MRHLRVLCAIADTGSLHRAARRLGVSQPSLTNQLRRIENSSEPNCSAAIGPAAARPSSAVPSSAGPAPWSTA